MSSLTVCNDGPTEVDKSIGSTIEEVSGNRIRPEITPPILHEIASLPPARLVKIFEVRYKLAHGTYNLDERLDWALDHLLEDINRTARLTG